MADADPLRALIWISTDGRFSDLNGATGLRIVDAILAGERRPEKLVELRAEQCSKTTAEELAAALQGDWREEHLFVLRQSLETYRHPLQQLEQCDAQIETVFTRVVVDPSAVADRVWAVVQVEAVDNLRRCH